MRTQANRPLITYLTPGRERRRQRPRLLWLLAVGLLATVLVSVLLLAQASASRTPSPADCPQGAISAIGPVDAKGRGDTIPDVRCIGP